MDCNSLCHAVCGPEYGVAGVTNPRPCRWPRQTWLGAQALQRGRSCVALPLSRHGYHSLGSQARTCSGRRKSLRTVLNAAVRDNPQNVDDPQVMPSPSFSAAECVEIQLEALIRNDDPWPNHGIQTAYEFGLDIGGMERSKYFGLLRDLYHFDHFMGAFANYLPELLGDFAAYTMVSCEEDTDTATVRVRLLDSTQQDTGRVRFHLARKVRGRSAGSWMTASLVRDTA